MDPVSALGVAAAIVQFLDVGVKALDTCRQIRDDATSSTVRNRELENAATVLRGLRKQLESTQRNQAPRRIVDVAKSCTAAADELLKLLEHIRGAGKQISTAKATFRALKERKTIEKLQNVLQSRQKVLDQLLVQDIWERFDVLSIQQSEQFAALNRNVQNLVDKLATQNQISQAGMSSLRDAIDTSTRDTHQQLADLSIRNRKHFEEAERKSQARIDEDWIKKQHEQFLHGLSYPEISERQNTIQSAAPTTFDWILDPSSDYVGSNFYHWLTHDSATYWICGKAGSGKSTLMAYIVEQSKTKQALKTWSQQRTLCILSFFFWLPGTTLQKSSVGLLRSLLFQICQAQPDLISFVAERLSIDQYSCPTWTEKQLSLALSVAMQAASQCCFCVFVDGLDEYSGDCNELVDLVFRLQAYENCKFCVASRPEVQLIGKLAHCEQLHLQDINREDIETLVRQKLFGSTSSASVATSIEDIADDIVERADGVFLWAVLVTKDIVRGIASADTAEMLRDRVDGAPTGINDLFVSMLGKVDEIHKESLAFYLQS